MEIFKRIASQTLIDLHDLEGDYRVANLPLDKAQSILYMVIAGVAILGMFGVDLMLFMGDPGALWLIGLYRILFLVVTSLIIVAMIKTTRVRTFDGLALGWISFTLVYLLVFNFTRPVNHLTTVFDIITVFALYVLSPLRHRTNMTLALLFTMGTLFIDFFVKTGVNAVTLAEAVSAQVVVHALGVGAALQLQSYRRKSYKAFIEERDAREMVAYLANIDPLTKSLTRRHFFSIAESEFRRFERYRRPFSVLVIDADSFKQINDTYGHHAGDIVLRSLSLVAMEQKRVQDTFGRLGGEEFGLILPETSLEQARVVAERIRAVWEQTPSTMDGRLIHSTVSIGVAEAIDGDKTFDAVLRRADLMMYNAKEHGRNRVAWE
jgi:diguanylate cyclase (GGDEF)-like protein